MPLVDLERYTGKWYEVCKLPIIYERGCDSATAKYTLDNKGMINVVNKCYKMGKKMWETEGKAFLSKEHMHEPGKLTVKFSAESGGNQGDYWLHWTDYDNYAVVGSPTGQFLWILSREERISKYEMDCLLVYVGVLGYDTDSLIFSDYIQFLQ